MLDKFKSNWFSILIIIQPILDIIAYFQYDNVIGSLAGYIRLVFMALIPLYVLTKTKKKKSFIMWFIVMGCFCLLHVINNFRVGYISIFKDLVYMARVIQMPILAISFMYYFECDKFQQYKKIPKVFYFNCLLIFVTMCIAHLTNTAEFTYEGYNFGLLGWFGNANSQSIIIVSLIPATIYFALKKDNLLFTIATLLFTWFLLFSNGTKAAYYAIFIIYICYAIYLIIEHFLHGRGKRKFPTIVVIFMLLLPVLSVAAYPLSPRYQMDNYSGNAREKDQKLMDEEMINLQKKNNGKVITVEDVINDEDIRKDIVEYYTPLLNKEMIDRFGAEKVLEKYDWLPDSHKVADMRIKKIVYAQLLWDQADPITKLFGFEFTNIDGFDLENDYPAIFYYYGYIGIALYAFFILFFFYKVLKSIILNFKDSVNTFNFVCLLTVALQLSLAQFSGAILRRPNASIYLSIMLALLYYRSNIAIKTSKK